MKTLVWVEHDGGAVKDATLSAVTAAAKLGEVHLLVAGEGVSAVAEGVSVTAGDATPSTLSIGVQIRGPKVKGKPKPRRWRPKTTGPAAPATRRRSGALRRTARTCCFPFDRLPPPTSWRRRFVTRSWAAPTPSPVGL